MATLIREAEVATVVLVDDAYDLNLDVAGLIGIIRGQKPEAEAVSALRERNINYESDDAAEALGDPPTWELELRAWWDRTPPDEHNALGALLGQSPSLPEQLGDLARMVNSAGAKYVGIAPREWPTKQSEILQAATAKDRLLCLFDLDLTGSGLGPDGGMTLLEAAIDQNPEAVDLGILSNKFSASQEEGEWRRLSNLGIVPANGYRPISKGRISEERSLAQGLKRLLQDRAVSAMRVEAARLVVEAATLSKEAVDALSAEDFELAVLKSSEDEGAWEVDTLLRLYSIQERIERRKLAYERKATFTPHVARIRALRAVETGPAGEASRQVVELRKSELYDGKEINSVYLPLELGDIFENIDGDLAVLLEPECDLVLRADGHRELERGTLVPLLKSDMPRSRPDIYPECTYFGKPPATWYLHLPRASVIDLDALDLVTEHADGSAKLNVKRTSFAEIQGPAMARLAEVRAKWTNVLDHHVRISSGLMTEPDKEWLLRGLGQAVSAGGHLLRLRVTEDTLDLGIKRVGRILRPMSTELLLRLHAYRSRAAFDHDFAAASWRRELVDNGDAEV